MPEYDFSTDRFIPELGVKLYPQDNPHELPAELAERMMRNDPNLLRPARVTTQARPPAVRKKAVRKRRAR